MSPSATDGAPPTADERDLDKSIKALKAKICKLRGVTSFTEKDVEAELKRWRELLHEYNEAKDACLYVFGQLSHLKMTTVKELYKEYNLELDS